MDDNCAFEVNVGPLTAAINASHQKAQARKRELYEQLMSGTVDDTSTAIKSYISGMQQVDAEERASNQAATDRAIEAEKNRRIVATPQPPASFAV